MVKDHLDNVKGIKLPPFHVLLFSISKGSFIYTIPRTGQYIPQTLCYTSCGEPAGMGNCLMGPPRRITLRTCHTSSECSTPKLHPVDIFKGRTQRRGSKCSANEQLV